MSDCLAKNSLGSERSSKWDIIKFIMIFLVVIGHAADYYTSDSEKMKSLFFFIYTFHMPVFIFISGLFAKRTVNEKRKDKIAGYLVLYLLFKIFVFAYKSILTGRPKFSLLTESAVPWFMLALFWFAAITIILKDFSPKFVLPVSIALACIVGYDSEIGDFLALSRVIVYYPFYYAGYIADAKKLEEICKNKILKVGSAFILTAFALFVFIFNDKVYWLRPLLTGRNPFSALGEFSDYGFILRLVYYAAVAVICFAIIAVTPDKTPFGIIPKLGQRTLSVYFFHSFVFYVVYTYVDGKAFFNSIFPSGAGWVIIPLSVIITLFLSLKPFSDFLSFFAVLPYKSKTEK